MGAAQSIGGSCYLIDTGKTRLLIDCGLYYGPDSGTRNSTFDFDPAALDAVFLTHAHMDHSGRIPLLYRKGFQGKVFGTDATKSLLGVMLEMNLAITEGEGAPPYGWEDYLTAMDRFEAVPYGEILRVGQEISVRFRDAGHILGSSVIELWVGEGKDAVKIVASGDLGNRGSPLLREARPIQEADYVLVESTYGVVKRGGDDLLRFGREIRKAVSDGGSVLIPAFVLEKTQKVLYALGELKRRGIISEGTPVYLDSGTGKEITDIYRRYRKYYNEEALSILAKHGDPLGFKGLEEISGKESLLTHDSGTPAVYVSSSGMLDHALSPKHLARMISDPKNLLAIVGWQAPGSVGRRLQTGDDFVSIPMEQEVNGKKETEYVIKPVQMKVRSFRGFSSHADGCQILAWLAHFSKVRKVFVVHGEKDSAVGLASAIRVELGFDASAPALGETASLSGSGPRRSLRIHGGICSHFSALEDLTSFSDQ